MAKTLSNDLRKRVVEAVEADCRAGRQRQNMMLARPVQSDGLNVIAGPEAGSRLGAVALKVRVLWRNTKMKFSNWWRVKKTLR